jgi:hypothetical protein
MYNQEVFRKYNKRANVIYTGGAGDGRIGGEKRERGEKDAGKKGKRNKLNKKCALTA